MTLALGMVLASYATEDGTGIRASSMTLASMLGCSERTLNKYINLLMADGWIKRAMLDNTASHRLAMPVRKG